MLADALESSTLRFRRYATDRMRHQIRVLAVIPEGFSNASMVFVNRQISSLREGGTVCEAFLLASRTSPWVLAKEWRRLRAMIHSFRPDVVHAHYGTVTALFTTLSTALPVVVTFRGSDLNPNRSDLRLRQAVSRLFSQLAALRAIQIICVSDQLKSKLWWRRDKIKVIPDGVDTKLFFPRSQKAVRMELGWDADEKIVLFNAGTTPVIKRFDLAQAAIEQAMRICGNIRFIVLDGNVQPDRIPAMMNAADCLLLTSDWEGSPNVVKEAIACNLPVVTVDVGDVRERLAGVVPSRIVSRDPGEIGSAVAELLRLAQRSNGCTHIRSLSCVEISDQIASVYASALEPN